jgi:urease accessory protein
VLQSAAGIGVDAPQLDRDPSVHKLDARLALRFERKGLRIIEQTPPLRVVRAFGNLVHLHNLSGGVLSGDRLSLDIEVAAGARAQVTTTGATRLYRHRTGSADSSQQTRIAVGDDALLEYLPDALIPYAGSRHTQSTEIVLGRNSTMFWWETLTPGRQAMGETFVFDRLRISTRVMNAEHPLLIEDFELSPHERPLESAARFGKYTHLASFYAFQTGRSPSKWRELENALNEFAREQGSSSIWGASMLAADGMVVRGLSPTARDVPATLAGLWSIARRFLTGEDAVPPRKIR